MLANILIPVYCHCGRPDSLDEMIQCDGCDTWFHFQCAHIKEPQIVIGFVPLVLSRHAVIVLVLSRHAVNTLSRYALKLV